MDGSPATARAMYAWWKMIMWRRLRRRSGGTHLTVQRGVTGCSALQPVDSSQFAKLDEHSDRCSSAAMASLCSRSIFSQQYAHVYTFCGRVLATNNVMKQTNAYRGKKLKCLKVGHAECDRHQRLIISRVACRKHLQ